MGHCDTNCRLVIICEGGGDAVGFGAKEYMILAPSCMSYGTTEWAPTFSADADMSCIGDAVAEVTIWPLAISSAVRSWAVMSAPSSVAEKTCCHGTGVGLSTTGAGVASVASAIAESIFCQYAAEMVSLGSGASSPGSPTCADCASSCRSGDLLERSCWRPIRKPSEEAAAPASAHRALRTMANTAVAIVAAAFIIAWRKGRVLGARESSRVQYRRVAGAF
mmetsp:Transcript_42039/g.91651  ORF Transcript_42039/g.91651 Transcript_42039/m.91651 type:complete len:221 (-) Transcript_42039:9-671(-)